MMRRRISQLIFLCTVTVLSFCAPELEAWEYEDTEIVCSQLASVLSVGSGVFVPGMLCAIVYCHCVDIELVR